MRSEDSRGRPRLPIWVHAALVLWAALVLATGARLELTGDEAYYWLWAKHPALSYYDHPPLVAACIRFGTLVAGDTELGVRLLGAPSIAAASLLLAGAARDLGGGRIAMVCAALFLPANLAGAAAGLIMTPDTPLLLTSALVLRLLAALAAGARASTWIAAGAALGLALLAKYTAAALALGAFVWLIATPRRRGTLATPWPWLGAVTAVAVFSPVLVWNLQHGFVSFLKQGGRVLGDERHGGLISLAEFALAQVALLTPVLGGIALLALVRLTREAFESRTDRAVLISTLVVPTLGFFALYALVGRIEANWTAVCLPALAVATALVAEAGYARPRMRAATLLGYVSGAALGLALVVYLLVPVEHGLGRLDPTQRISGYAQLADDTARAAEAIGTREVVTAGYQLGALLAFYSKERYRVTTLTERQRYFMMPPVDETALSRAPVLAVTPRPEWLPLFEAFFERVTPLATVERRHRGVGVQSFTLYRAEGYRAGTLRGLDEMVRGVR